jgi:hypothetical protein
METLSYSNKFKGWTSFWSFIPDWMMGMNQYFYTWKGGNLYRHNTNAVRNNFYGVQYNSQVTSIFNATPLQNSLFKTLQLEGTEGWAALLETDIQNTGYIEKAWFTKKEGAWFAFIRNENNVPTSEYALRSLNGMARSESVIGPVNAPIVQFPITPLVNISTMVNVGDYLYFSVPPYTVPVLAGKVTQVVFQPNLGNNQVWVDGTITGANPIPLQDAFFLSVKNSVAESQGVLGHYCEFTLTNDSTTATELFAVTADIMKSFP